MIVFEQQVFKRFYDRDSAAVFESIEFRHCSFESSGISITRDPQLRSVIRDITLIDCEENGCAIESAILENVVVDGFRTADLFQVFGAVFKHVTIRGKIGRLMITGKLAPSLGAKASDEARFAAANSAYYSATDWALDISKAEFAEADLRGIPARLVRRDPATQVVVTREKVMRGDWRKLEFGDNLWPLCLKMFLRDGDPDIILIAPKQSRNFRCLVEGLELLRRAGVAESE